jgi:hypothetical protein
MPVQRRLRARGPRLFAAAVLGTVIAALGCVVGPDEEPGCHRDAECDEGFACRAGACFRTTTDASPPPAPDGGDAGGDA